MPKKVKRKVRARRKRVTPSSAVRQSNPALAAIDSVADEVRQAQAAVTEAVDNYVAQAKANLVAETQQEQIAIDSANHALQQAESDTDQAVQIANQQMSAALEAAQTAVSQSIAASNQKLAAEGMVGKEQDIPQPEQREQFA